jgi:hypothetical protein
LALIPAHSGTSIRAKVATGANSENEPAATRRFELVIGVGGARSPNPESQPSTVLDSKLQLEHTDLPFKQVAENAHVPDTLQAPAEHCIPALHAWATGNTQVPAEQVPAPTTVVADEHLLPGQSLLVQQLPDGMHVLLQSFEPVLHAYEHRWLLQVAVALARAGQSVRCLQRPPAVKAESTS